MVVVENSVFCEDEDMYGEFVDEVELKFDFVFDNVVGFYWKDICMEKMIVE